MKYLKFTTFLIILVGSTNVLAQNYYIKSDGNDNADGTTDATAWKTLAKANKYPFKSGDDIYLRAGDKWDKQQLKIFASGTHENRTVVDSYYMSEGIPVAGVPAGTNKPTINGTYPALFETYGAVPGGRFGALVEVRANYVTVKNLNLTNSAGISLVVAKKHHHAVIEDNIFDKAAGGTMQFERNSHDNIMRNNISRFCGLLVRDAPHKGTHPSCNSAVYSWNNIFEGNYVTQAYGEGMAAFGRSSDNNIFRGNTLAGIFSVGFYFDNGANNIAEDNMVIGDPSGEFDRDRLGYPGPAFNVTIEAINKPDNGTGNIIRNNLIAGVKYCFTAGVWEEPYAAGKRVGGKFIGNTCVGVLKPIIIWNNGNIDPTDKIEIANNIFWDYDLECDGDPSGNLIMHHNSWESTPTDTTCRGTGDVIGNPNLNTSKDFRLFSPSNMPTTSDFMPIVGSIADNAGIPMSTTILNSADYPLHYELSNSLSLKAIEHDYFFNLRDPVTPDIGAMEIGSSPLLTTQPNTPNPTPSQLSLPFYMNIGGTTEMVLSKTYESEQYRIVDSSWASSHPTIVDIAGTAEDTLYQTWRANTGNMLWEIPITQNTNVDVILKFSEQYWGNKEGTCTGGERRFDIIIEGALEEDEYDICAIAGAANTAVLYEKRAVIVTDGKLNIQLNTGSSGMPDNNPLLAGIEIIASEAIVAPQPPSNVIVSIKPDTTL